ncbi:MAG: EamA family transporter [Spirochaetaceae bacterium]|nr:EamA family transporter [Spirochaetaceae bacterium]
MNSKQNKANFQAVFSIILWCFSGICMRKGAVLLKPMIYLGLITGIGVLAAVFIQFFMKKRISQLFRLPKKVIIAGFFGVTVYTLFLATAFAIAEPDEIGLINLLNYLWPMWMVLLEVLLLKKQPGKRLLFLGIFLGFTGLVMASRPDTIFNVSGNFLPHILALSGGLFWAFYSVLIRKWDIPKEQSGTAFHFMICALISFLIALFSGEFSSLPALTGESLFWIMAGGVGPVGIAYYLWELGIKDGSVSFIASLSYFIPIVSSVLIGVIFRESMHIGLIPGAVSIAAGAYFVQKAMVPGSGEFNSGEEYS